MEPPCTAADAGSSPLARGTRTGGTGGWRSGRFIPARAGNTRGAHHHHRRPTVHPRSRGEHTVRAPDAADSGGSSPLAWGTHARPDLARGAGRFIPARAGNTTPCPISAPPPTVHPRSRGEHPPTSRPAATCHGSSPLARGTLKRLRGQVSRARFIPARAGNTRTHTWPSRKQTVHPRSRGEHAYTTVLLPATTGSSPLARGTPCPPSYWESGGRFIPARAGNTVA